MSEREKLYLDFHGCQLEFRCADRALLDWISSDFSAFVTTAADKPGIVLTAEASDAGKSAGPALFKTRKWHILRSGPGRRLVWYPEGASCEYDHSSATGRLKSSNKDLLRELSYLLILSLSGEALDRMGLHRLHAGALGHGGRAILFCGAQGAGKTTVLLELLKDRSFSLLSDDTPLISADGTVHQFSSRIGLREDSPHLKHLPQLRSFKRRHYPPKRLLDISGSGLTISAALPPAFIFKLFRSSRPAIRIPAAGEAAWELGKSLVAGWGVPQMAEYFLRLSPSDIASKAKILASRVKTARALMSRASFMIFETGPDHSENAAALKTFLRNGSVRE